MTKCDKCQRCAIIYQRYSGMHLCREHFEEDVHRKIRESLRKTGLFGRGARMAVGLDGGRKSATLAFVLKNLFFSRRDIDLLAVIIDEGKETCPTADQARHVAEQLEIPYIVKESCRCLPDEDASSIVHIRPEDGAAFLHCSRRMEPAFSPPARPWMMRPWTIFISYLRGDVDAVCIGKALSAKSKMSPG